MNSFRKGDPVVHLDMVKTARIKDKITRTHAPSPRTGFLARNYKDFSPEKLKRVYVKAQLKVLN